MNRRALLAGFLVASLLVTSRATAAEPDHRITPGALCASTSIGFQGYVYPEHVAHCARVVTNATRRAVLASYGVAWQMRGLYEVDHLIPLCLGGSNDRANLWAEPWVHARAKDRLEVRLCSALRAGRISQLAAVMQLLSWRL